MTMRSLTFAIAGLFTVLAQAALTPPPPEDLPTAVQRQLESREAIQKKADEAQAALRAWYQAALDAVKKDALSKGDLDGVVAADTERDRTERDLTEQEKNSLPKVSRAVRDKYDEARALQAKQFNGAVTASLQAYAAALESLEKRLTQQGKLEDAIATRVERSKVSGLLAGGGARAPAPEAAPRPGPPSPAATPAPKPQPAVAAIQGISRENPAKIECEDMNPSLIEEGGSGQIEKWTSVPAEFKGATIYYPKTVKADQSKAAVIYKTLEPGRVYAVCNFTSQGNPSGGWMNDRWTEADFLAHGWARVAGAEFVNEKGGVYMVLTKVLTKEDAGRLRSNKYNPPYLVTFAPAGS
jgi:hypothetical protein